MINKHRFFTIISVFIMIDSSCLCVCQSVYSLVRVPGIILIVAADRFYIALFSALDPTLGLLSHVILNFRRKRNFCVRSIPASIPLPEKRNRKIHTKRLT